MFSHKPRLGQRMPFGGESATRVRADGASGVDAKSPSMRGDCAVRLVEFANKEVEPTIRQGDGAAIGVAQRRDHVENEQQADLVPQRDRRGKRGSGVHCGCERGIGAARTIRCQAVASIASQAPPGLLRSPSTDPGKLGARLRRTSCTRDGREYSKDVRCFRTAPIQCAKPGLFSIRRCASSPSLRRCELRIALNPPACAPSSAGNSW